jgi:FO synthase
MYLKGRARRGPTFREAILMHAVARLALHGLIDNIQTSWVKMGEQGVAACLAAGANDLGGTLMNESITRAAGSGHGQEWAPEFMEQQIIAAGRVPRIRTTLYHDVAPDRRRAAFAAMPLVAVENASAGKRERSKRLVPTDTVRLDLETRDRAHPLYEQVMLMAACN